MLAPVAITLIANVTEAAANIEKFGASVGGMGTEVTAMGGKVSEGFASAGATVDEFGRVAVTTAEQAAAANDRILASMAELSAQADRTAEQWYLDQTKMAAATQKFAADLEAAEAKAVASTEAMGAKLDEVAAASGGKLETAAGKMKLVGLAGAVVAGAAVKMAADFQTSTNKLVTSAGETESGLDQVRQGILSMAGEVGVSAEHLSDAMYKVESAGYHGSAGLGLLKAAEQGAKAEGADGVRVADALSSAMRDYYPHAQSAADVTQHSADVMSKLIGATSAGKMTFDELSGSLNSILPVASAAHISLDDVLGTLASMTVHGISADQATQNMADAIRHLQAPTQAMSKAMSTLGIDSNDVAQKLGQRGLAGTMQYLSDAVKKSMPPGSDKVILDLGNAAKQSSPQVQALAKQVLDGSISMGDFTKAAKGLDPISAKQAASFATLAGSYHQLGNKQMSGAQVMATYGGTMQKLMGDATGLKVALMTTGENADYTAGAIKQVGGATADAQGNVKGWSEIQGSFNQKVAQAKDGLGAMAIAVGEQLLPVATKIASVIGTVTQYLAEHKAAATAVAIVIGGMLVVGLAAATVATWSFTVALLANPAVWIVVGIMALIAAIVLLVTHWKQVEAWLKGVWKGFVDWAKGLWNTVGDFFKDLWNKVKNFFKDIWESIVSWLKEKFEENIEIYKRTWTKIKDFFTDLWNTVKNFFKDTWNSIVNWLKDKFNENIEMYKNAWGKLKDFFRNLWENIKNGVHDAWDAVLDWFRSIPGKIGDFFADAGRWLWNAGKAILEGLWNGLKAAWNNVTSFIGGIGSWISEHKGPIEYDRQLLVPHGNAIMDGLHEGLKSGGKRVQSYLDGFTTGIGHTAIGGNLSIGDSALAGPAGSLVHPMPEQLLIQMNARDVQAWLQTGILRYNLRNSSNGLAVTAP